MAITVVGTQVTTLAGVSKPGYAVTTTNTLTQAQLPNSATIVLAEPVNPGTERMLIVVSATGNALAGFTIAASADPTGAGTFVNLATATTDYTTPNNFMMKASGDLAALTAGSTGYAIINVKGLAYLKITATSSAAGGTGLVLTTNVN